VQLVITEETLRHAALDIATKLRRAGVSVDFPLTGAKVAKQFQAAEKSGARFALVIGTEFPELKLKILASRTEETGHADEIVEWITTRLQQPDGPLLV